MSLSEGDYVRIVGIDFDRLKIAKIEGQDAVCEWPANAQLLSHRFPLELLEPAEHVGNTSQFPDDWAKHAS